MTFRIERRLWIRVNTDPQRRCYYGTHFSSELQWTEWAVLESGFSDEQIERRLEFWRGLNDYAVGERGEEGTKEEFRSVKEE
jgi:hypothetical protein